MSFWWSHNHWIEFDENINPTLKAIKEYLGLSGNELKMIMIKGPSIIKLILMATSNQCWKF